jgi:dimethylglycine catabolism A
LAVARAPKREDYANVPAWLANQAKKAGVEIRLNTRASGADVLALRPDAVIVATGATQRLPDIPGVKLPHVSTTVDVLMGRTAPGRRAVIVDEEGYFAAPSTADFLAERGAQVTIVCRYFMVGEDIDEGTRSDLYARLFARGVTLQPMTRAIEVLPQGVRTRHTFSNAEAIVEADSVVIAFGGKAHDPLSRELEGKVAELKVIGDAYSPRRVHDAILDGTRVARAL